MAVAVIARRIVLLVRRHRGAIKNVPSESRFAFLEWTGKGPCFCRLTIQMDLDKLEPTPETVGTIFG